MRRSQGDPAMTREMASEREVRAPAGAPPAGVGESASGGAMQLVLRASDLAFEFPPVEGGSKGGVAAVECVDLSLPAGRILGVVGPSGCGKSTLLSLLAGLHQPTRGSIQWSSEDESSLDERKRRMFTLVFQKDTLFPWLRVDANVGWGLRYLDLTKKEKTERIAFLLELAGLSDAARLFPYQLSGGMKRRVAFLAGVAPFPRALLLDEPFSALDEPTRVSIHGEVLRITRELGIAVIIVTHDLSEAISLSDEVYILTSRPAKVAEVHQVNFGKFRDVRQLRETSEYQRLYQALWHDLSAQINER